MAGEAATIQGIEFEIKGSATKASDSLKELSDSLASIKSTANGGVGLKSISKEIKDFANGLKEINAEKISSFKSAIYELSKIKISGQFSRSIKSISQSLTSIDASKLKAIFDAAKGIRSVEKSDSASGKGFSAFAQAASGANFVNLMKAINDGAGQVGAVSDYLQKISEIDFSNLSTAAQSIQAIVVSASAISTGNNQDSSAGQENVSDEVSNILMMAGTVGKVMGGIIKIASAAKKVGDALTFHMIKPMQTVLSITKNIFNTFLSMPKKFVSAAGSVTKFISGKFIGQFTKPFANAISSIQTFTKSIGRIAFYRVIRTLIKEITDAFKTGIDNLYQWSAVSGGEFASSMDRMATSMQYFKNSIGAAVAPLLNSLAPALDYVIDKVVDFINTINRLFAQLTGASYWTKALKTPIQYADAASSAGSAAKEAMRYLAPFDELNVLPADNGGGRGGGASGADYSTMFEDVALERSAWIENIRDLMERGEWGLLGSTLASKLNSIIDDWDAEAWGRRFGEAIQNGVDFAVALLSGLSTSRWGTKLADFINGLIDEIDPETIGELIALPLQKGIEFAFGFIQRIHWTSDEENIGIGAWLAGVVNGWFETIDFYLAGQTIHDAAVGMLEAVGEFLDGLTWEDVKVSFKNFWNGLNVGDIWDKFKTLVTEKTGSVTFGEAIGKIAGKFGGLIAPIIQKIKSLPLKKIWDEFSTSLANELGYDSFRALISDAAKMIGDWIGQIVDAIPWNKIMYTIGKAVGTAAPYIWQGVESGIGGAMSGIYESVTGNDVSGSQYWKTDESGNRYATWGGNVYPIPDNASTEGMSLNVTGRVTRLDDGLTKRQKATGLKGLTAHADRFGDSIKSMDKVVNNAIARMQTVQDDIPNSKKSIQTTAEFTSKIDSIRDKLLRSFRADLTDKKDSIRDKLLRSFRADLTDKKDSIGNRMLYGFGAELLTKTDNIKDRYMTGFVAKFTKSEDSLPSLDKTINTAAKYTKSLDYLSNGDKQVSGWLRYASSLFALSADDKTASGFLRYTSAIFSGLTGEDRIANGTIRYTKADKNSLTTSDKTVNVTAKITNFSGSYKIVPQQYGGVFSNGHWNPIQAYAGGGYVGGQLFVAREAGPELVGTLRGHTAVMNNDQIVASVSAGVARAISGIQFHMDGFGAANVPTYDQGDDTEEMLYRAFVRALEETGLIVEIDNHIDLDGNQIYENVVRHNDAETRRLGRNRMMQRV